MIDESKLIFIISQPRSGSTLLQKLISNNKHVDTVSEPWLLLPLLSIYKPSLIEAKYNYNVALQGFFAYLEKKGVDGVFKTDMKKMILSLYSGGDDHLFFVDKTPRYYEIIPEILEFFPNAKFLVLKRNPFASLHSMLTTWSQDKIDYTLINAFYRDFLVAPFRIQEFCEKHGTKPNVLEVKYENIVSDPQQYVKAIYDWMNIPFDASVLDIDKNAKVKGMFGDDVYKKEPLKEIKSALSDSWRDSLADKKRKEFFGGYENFLGADFISKYGYAPENFSSGKSLFKKDEFAEYIATLKKNNSI
jgi:hypothetical protein